MSGGYRLGKIRKTREDGFLFHGEQRLCESKKDREGTQESAEGWDKADFDEPGCLETILCLILPDKRAGGPERVKAWFKVTQQLALGADLPAWGPGCRPPL